MSTGSDASTPRCSTPAPASRRSAMRLWALVIAHGFPFIELLVCKELLTATGLLPVIDEMKGFFQK